MELCYRLRLPGKQSHHCQKTQHQYRNAQNHWNPIPSLWFVWYVNMFTRRYSLEEFVKFWRLPKLSSFCSPLWSGLWCSVPHVTPHNSNSIGMSMLKNHRISYKTYCNVTSIVLDKVPFNPAHAAQINQLLINQTHWTFIADALQFLRMVCVQRVLWHLHRGLSSKKNGAHYPMADLMNKLRKLSGSHPSQATKNYR